MKKVGIVGGIGPVSTVDYYNGIINGVRSKIKEDHYPEILINSINMTEMLSYVSSENWDALIEMLLNAIQNLANAGAEFVVIASNTPHIVFDEIQKKSVLPILSIVEETCKFAASKGCKKAVVLGTRFTMGSGLYSEVLNKHTIKAIIPSEADQAQIHAIIFPKLEDGIVVPEDKEKMIAIANRLLAEEEADAVILGCTELPLMIKDADLETLILNTTQIHVEAIVNYMLSESVG